MKNLLLFLVLFALGCADNPLQGPTPTALPAPPPPPQNPYQRAEGSLWSGDVSRRFLAFENRAKRVGDHVTVQIVERAEAENTSQTKLDRTSNYEATLDSDISLQTIVSRPIINLLGFLGFTDQKTDKDPDSELSIVDAQSKTEFDGKGKSIQDATFITTLTCIVTEVTEAGTFRIEGSRNLMIANENQIITLVGYVRPEDIQIDNTVKSTFLARTEIHYGGRGPLSGNQQAPWLMRLFNMILPF